jgi:hypothetical protein
MISMKNKWPLMYFCMNGGVLGWCVLAYWNGARVPTLVLTALLSAAVGDGTLWLAHRKEKQNDNIAGGICGTGATEIVRWPRKYRWLGVASLCLGAPLVGHGVSGAFNAAGSIDVSSLYFGAVLLGSGALVVLRSRSQ